MEQLKAMLARAEKRMDSQERVISQLRDQLTRMQDVMRLITPAELEEPDLEQLSADARVRRGELIEKLRMGLDPRGAPPSSRLGTRSDAGSSSGMYDGEEGMS